MVRKDRGTLADRVFQAAETSLAAQKYAAPIDVLLGIGWLTPSAVSDWRHGRIAYLEQAIQTHPDRLAQAIELFAAWVSRKGLIPSDTRYVARTVEQQDLRFSLSGNPQVEQLYRTHWVSPVLSEKKRQQLVDKTNRAPELVVVQPLKHTWTCHRCGSTGDLLIMEPAGPACLPCAGLGDLVFLPSGDALLTRRVKAKSARHAVVVRFSRTRRRYERQGLLVESKTLAAVQRELSEKGES